MRNPLLAALSYNKPLKLSLILLLLSVPAAAPAQGSAQPTPPETVNASGAITGRVVGDDGRPFPEVQVYLFASYSSMSPRAATTDTSGRFQFQNLPAGLYNVRASSPSYVELPDESRGPLEPGFLKPGDSVQVTLVRGGVITGTILNAQGEPLVAANVRAIRVRDVQGQGLPLEFGYTGMPRLTDDRGVYRIYGLLPGSYLVIVGGNSPFFNLFNPYESDAPTYYPSSTRDTAAEVSVRAGEESTGVDIRYRGERGYVISGAVTGATSPTGRYALNMILTRVATGVMEAQTFVSDMGSRRVFSISGIPEGEYDLVAQGFLERGEAVASLPRRLRVRGADVTGLQLELAPLASVAGRVTLEPSEDRACAKLDAASAMRQTLVTVRLNDWGRERQQPPLMASTSAPPNEGGEFVARNLDGGIYRIAVRAPADDWYVRAVTLPTRNANEQVKASEGKAPFGTFSLKRGERISGVNLVLAQGAASLRGRLSAPEGTQLPANLRAYIVPAERERADDILRYAEARVATGGAFNFNSLAPGRYWILFRSAPESEATGAPRMVAWDDEPRRSLRREAEAAGNGLELKPCQRLSDYRLSSTVK